MRTSEAEVLLPAVRPPAIPRQIDRMPFFRTIGYTLDISARFLLRALVGKGSIAAADRLLDGWWRRILRAGNATLKATGRHHFVAGQSYVVMSNHASLLDIPAIVGAVPGSCRMVTKEELTKLPIWGQALIASGFVPVDRKNRDKAIRQLAKAKEMLEKGVTIWVSPEGTRSRTGLLAAFKKGGFHVAMDLGVPIIPAWIEGAADIIPPDQLVARYDGTCTVRFGPPIQTAGRSKDDLTALMAEVRTAILDLSGRPMEVDATRRAA